MRSNRVFTGLRAALAISAVLLFATSICAAQQETVLHSFGNGTDGRDPQAGLVMDSHGNLYGTTYSGGIHCLGGCGTVFELSPREGGGYTETVLHSFGGDNDGTYPAAGLILDATAGNLYGTTVYGGIHGDGTVFELSPNGSGGYTETVLHSFGYPATQDGQNPYAGLIFDAAGNLYGTTASGGIHGWGTVFELSPRPGGGWMETVLHSFNKNGSDGADPEGDLILDGAGNLYGTTTVGGIHSCNGYSCGTVFELSPNGSGGWTETVLHSFGNRTDGAVPYDGLILDAAGNLYGTTSAGGIHTSCSSFGFVGCGTVFQLSPNGSGGWTETVLHSFGNGTDGQDPIAGLTFDAGNLYGTTLHGGIHTSCSFAGWVGCGTAFELSPSGSGGWTETVLHSFGNGTDGSGPCAGLIFDAAGNLYGTTEDGGIHSAGTVFELTALINWEQFRFVPSHTGFNPYEFVLSPATVGNLVLKWRYTTGDHVFGSPAVANGLVYVPSGDYNLYALNTSTGALVWRYTAGYYVYSAPAVANGVVYVGSADDNLYALNASTGALLWNYTAGNVIQSCPAVANGVVYVGSADDNLYALNASTGALLWRYTTGSSVDSSPAVTNGVVYVGSGDHNLYALDATTGAFLWKYTTGAYIGSSPAVVNGVVYIGSDDNSVYALNASTGALLWKYTTGSGVYSSPAVANGVVYVGSTDLNLYALNASTGALLWKYTTRNSVQSSPAVANGVVYVGSLDNYLYALDASTGAFLWKYATGNQIYSSPAVANGMVYVGSQNGSVFTFHLPNQ